MSAQNVARIFGAVFVLVGILGFALGGFGMTEYHLLGLFPVNALHNAAHLLIGVWGLVAGGSAAGATSYCKLTGVLYLLLTVVGFVDPTGFGLLPLGGNDRWLHLVLGIVLAYVGFAGARAPAAAPMGA